MKVRNSIFKVKRYIAVQVVLTLVATVAYALIPAYNRYLVDRVFQNSGKGFIPLILAYIASFAVFLAATWGSERFVWKCTISFENSLKKECYAFFLKMKYKDYIKQRNEEYLSILTNNITSIDQDYLQPICALIKSIVSVIIYIVIVSIYTTPVICVALLILSIMAAFSPIFYKKKLGQAGKNYVDEAAKYTKKVSDLLDGSELIDSISRPAFEKENASATDSLSKKRHSAGKIKVNGNTISGTAVCLIDVVIFILCGFMMLNGNITVGMAVASITYAQSFMEPIQEILYDINMLNASKEIVASLESMLTISDNEGNVYLEDARQKSLEFGLEDVLVCYPEKTLHYNVKFFTGKKYLISGESGHGKTTLFDTLVGRNGASGTCKILSEDDCFYLSQHQHIFNDSAFNNITIFGAYPEVDAGTAHKIPFYDRISNAPDCAVLSGGEKQAVKLCRMLTQKKPILLLDEPFSAMDNDNARRAFHFLTMMSETIILVSHNTEFEKADLEHWEKIRIEDICYEE